MTTEDISYSLERSKMDELLYDLSLGIVEAKNKRLSKEDLDFLCEKGFAFKLTDKDLIGSKYLRNYVIKLLKKDERLDIRLKIGTHLISPFLASDILNDLVIEGIALREGKHFIPNIDKFISEDSIENICRHRIDTLTIENITKEIGFTAKVVASFEEKVPSKAYIRCKHIVDALVQKRFLSQTKIIPVFSIGTLKKRIKWTKGIDKYIKKRENKGTVPLTLPQHRITLKGHAMNTYNILNYNFPFNLKNGIILPFNIYDPIKKIEHPLSGLLDTGFTGFCGISTQLAQELQLTALDIKSLGINLPINEDAILGDNSTIKTKMYYGQISFAGKLIKSWVSSIDNGSTLLGLGFLMSLEGKTIISQNIITFDMENENEL